MARTNRIIFFDQKNSPDSHTPYCTLSTTRGIYEVHLWALRKEHGLTQQALANAINLHAN